MNTWATWAEREMPAALPCCPAMLPHRGRAAPQGRQASGLLRFFEGWKSSWMFLRSTFPSEQSSQSKQLWPCLVAQPGTGVRSVLCSHQARQPPVSVCPGQPRHTHPLGSVLTVPPARTAPGPNPGQPTGYSNSLLPQDMISGCWQQLLPVLLTHFCCLNCTISCFRKNKQCFFVPEPKMIFTL